MKRKTDVIAYETINKRYKFLNRKKLQFMESMEDI